MSLNLTIFVNVNDNIIFENSDTKIILDFSWYYTMLLWIVGFLHFSKHSTIIA